MPSAAHRLPSRRRGGGVAPSVSGPMGGTGANAVVLAVGSGGSSSARKHAAGGAVEQEDLPPKSQQQAQQRVKSKRSDGALLGGREREGREGRVGLRTITRKVASDDNMRLSAAAAAAAAAEQSAGGAGAGPAGENKKSRTIGKKASMPALRHAQTTTTTTLVPAPHLPVKPAFLPGLGVGGGAGAVSPSAGLAGLPPKPAFAVEMPPPAPRSAPLQPQTQIGDTTTAPAQATRYPRSLSRMASAPVLRGAKLPARPDFEQFPRGVAGGRGRVPSPSSAASSQRAASGGSAQGGSGKAEQDVEGPTPRKTSGGRHRGGKGRSRKQAKGGANGSAEPEAGATAGEITPPHTEDTSRGRSEDPSPIPVYTAENVQSSSPAPVPSPAPPARTTAIPPSPSPRHRGESTPPHRGSAAQPIPRGPRAVAATTSAPASPVPNSYQSLEDLLSQAGYRETRVFTPEAEKLRTQRREAAERRQEQKERTHKPVREAYAAEPPRGVVTSPPFQDMATFPEVEGASPPVNGASWWNALALPWTAPPVANTSTGPDTAVASLQHALRADAGQTVRKMWSANDVSPRATGFDWADESLESIVATQTGRPELSRHWTDSAAQESAGWRDGSPVKRKRKVLNRVDLEISLATTASTQSITTTTDSEQSVVYMLQEDTALDQSPTTLSDAGTIKPSKIAREDPIEHLRMASIGSVGAFDPLAYESRHSGDFEDLVGASSEAGSSLAGSPVRPAPATAQKTPSPASRKATPPRPLLKHAMSVPALPCSGTAEWDVMLASLPPLPPVPSTAPIQPATKRATRPAPPPRALTAVLSAPKQPASPMLVRSAHIVCDSNQPEDMPPLAALADTSTQPPSMMRTLRSVMSLSALRYRKETVAAATTAHTREASVALTLTPKPGLDAQEWVPTATPAPRPHGFNVLYHRQANSPKYKYTDNVDEIEALNAAMEHDYLRKEPDFTQSFFYQPPTPPKPPGSADDSTNRREAKRQRSIKSLRAHLLKKTVGTVAKAGGEAVPPVPPLPSGLQRSQPQRIDDRRPPPPVFAISSPGATEAGLPPRELLLEGEEWDAGSLEGIKAREASGLVHGKRLTKRPSLKKKRSGERRA